MSNAIRKLRKRVNYEVNVPRCSNCMHFKKARIVLLDSLPRHVQPQCRRHLFGVSKWGLCDTWESADGKDRLVP